MVMFSNNALERTFNFLNSIGITVTLQHGVNGFLPGIKINDGKLIIDPVRCPVSNLLHEAGHLAITPSQYRTWMSDDLEQGQKAMLEDVQRIVKQTGDVDGPLYRAAVQTSDVEATAWAWAAGKRLGLDETQIIQDDEYDGQGADLRLQLSMRRYLGINGLQHAGFCATSESAGKYMNLPVYPQLARWLQA